MSWNLFNVIFLLAFSSSLTAFSSLSFSVWQMLFLILFLLCWNCWQLSGQWWMTLTPLMWLEGLKRLWNWEIWGASLPAKGRRKKLALTLLPKVSKLCLHACWAFSICIYSGMWAFWEEVNLGFFCFICGVVFWCVMAKLALLFTNRYWEERGWIVFFVSSARKPLNAVEVAALVGLGGALSVLCD